MLPLLLAAWGLIPRTVRWLPGAAAAADGGAGAGGLWACCRRFAAAPRRTAGRDFGADGVGAAFLVLTTVSPPRRWSRRRFSFPPSARRRRSRSSRGAPAGHRVTDRRLGLFYTLAGLFVVAMYARAAGAQPRLSLDRHGGDHADVGAAGLLPPQPARAGGDLEVPAALQRRHRVRALRHGAHLRRLAAGRGRRRDAGCWRGSGARRRPSTRACCGSASSSASWATAPRPGSSRSTTGCPTPTARRPRRPPRCSPGALLNCALVALWRISQVMVAAGQAPLVRQPAGAGGGGHRARGGPDAGAPARSQADVGLLQRGARRAAYAGHRHRVGAACSCSTRSTTAWSRPRSSSWRATCSTSTAPSRSGSWAACCGPRPCWAILLLGGRALPWPEARRSARSSASGCCCATPLAVGEVWAAVLVLVGLTVTFVAVAAHVGRVLFGGRAAGIRTARRVGGRPAVLLRSRWCGCSLPASCWPSRRGRSPVRPALRRRRT